MNSFNVHSDYTPCSSPPSHCYIRTCSGEDEAPAYHDPDATGQYHNNNNNNDNNTCNNTVLRIDYPGLDGIKSEPPRAVEETATATATGHPPPSTTKKRPAATKRKRASRYTDAHHASQRRRDQNRASQRAYRERKDQRIKDLEQMLSEATHQNRLLSEAYASLQAMYVELFQMTPGKHDAATTTRNGGAGIPVCHSSLAPCWAKGGQGGGGFWNGSRLVFEVED
ncbi:hypothetical protein QBC34DRAFT_438880 [Podospora aff. communis PSN243]|uniref:Putative transcription factor kapC n=1 Tax=Podospora aff. communis PSN243 TaxID=3040156 RepID=A0AAV9GJR3_9PEZI|nr:hypothetical protein QBC34DRAFT_438880 [Podospora aff. communis PSN243]